MEKIMQSGRAFYGIGVAGTGIQQIMGGYFRPFILPFWPSSISGLSLWAYITGGILILAGIFIALGRKAAVVSLALGIFFLLLVVFFHGYQLVHDPNWRELAVWINPLKELAFSGGAFIIAASFATDKSSAGNSLLLITGRIFFSAMLIVFGISHFRYTDFVVTLVPDWIPGHLFWTYFAAIALIGSGLCILLKIQIRLVSILLGIMLLVWFAILHIPRAVAAPATDKGNELTSVFQSLAFSGIAFVIASIYRKKRGSNNLSL